MRSKVGKYWFCDMRSKLGKYWFCDMRSKLGKYWFCDMRSQPTVRNLSHKSDTEEVHIYLVWTLSCDSRWTHSL